MTQMSSAYRVTAVLTVLVLLVLVAPCFSAFIPADLWVARADTARATGAQDVGSTPGQVNYYPNGYPAKASVLYTFNISVSFQWQLPMSEMLTYKNYVRDFNAKLYDGTDGQMAIEKVDLWNNQNHWDATDVRYYHTTGRAYTYRGGIDYEGGHIFMYTNDGGKVLQHEFGHYGLYLPDEYTDQYGAFCTCTQGSTYNTDEWCCDNNHNFASQYAEGKSCWQQMVDNYPHITEKNPPVGGPYDEPEPFFMYHSQFDFATQDANMTIWPLAPSVGDSVWVNVTFTNYNYSIDGDQRFDLFLTDPALGGQPAVSVVYNVRDLPIFTVPFNFQVGQGLNDFWVKGDPNNTIAEMYENNNIAHGQVYVNFRPAISPAMPKKFTGFEDTPLVLNLTDYEMDKDDNNASLVWNVSGVDTAKIASMTADYAEDKFTFTPLADWNGLTRVDLKLSDPKGASVSTTVDLEFEPVNDLPSVTSIEIDKHGDLRGNSVNVMLRGMDKETIEIALTPEIEYKAPGDAWAALDPAWSNGFKAMMETTYSSPLGNYSFRGRVVDSDEGQSDWSYLNETFWLLNNPPEMMGVVASASMLYRTESTTVQLSALDKEDSADLLTWVVEVRGPDGASRLFEGPINYVAGYSEITFETDATTELGLYHFSAVATDKDGNATIWLEDVDGVIVINNAPYTDYIKVSGTYVYRTQSIEVRAVGKDVEQGTDGLIPEFQYSFGSQWMTEYLSKPYFDAAKGEWIANFTPPVGSSLDSVTFQARFTDADGETSNWAKSDAVQVRNNPPVCRMDGPIKGQTGDNLKFYGSNSSDVEGQITYLWVFGDGLTSTDANPVHKYSAARTYTVSLTVKDPNGVTDSKSITVVVSKKPEPPTPFTPGSGRGSLISTWLLLAIIVLIAVVAFIGGAVFAVRRNRKKPEQPAAAAGAAAPSLLYEEFDGPVEEKPKDAPGPPKPAEAPKPQAEPPKDAPKEGPKDAPKAPEKPPEQPTPPPKP